MKRTEVSAALLRDVKNNLNITWNDIVTDETVCGYIAAGSEYLDSLGGGCLDYDEDGLARTLLLEYCRYAHSLALDVFDNNYLSLILSLKNTERMKRYEA